MQPSLDRGELRRTSAGAGGSQVKIMIRCPQCGGDIDFLEEAHVICCEYCGSSLLVAGRHGVLRYVLPHRIDGPREVDSKALGHLRNIGRGEPRIVKTLLFYAPFWRIQGMVFRWVFGRKFDKTSSWAVAPSSTELVKVLITRVLDHTIEGSASVDLGIQTLGVRSQVLRLQVFSRAHLQKRNAFLPLEIPLKDIKAEAKGISEFLLQADDVEPELILHRLIGGRLSVIYFPIWYVECRHKRGREILLIDAVGTGVIQRLDDGSPILEKLMGDSSSKSFRFKEIFFLPFVVQTADGTYPIVHSV